MTDITQTPQFQQWFGDSKVVDQSGHPIRLYRGMYGNHIGQLDRMEGRPNYAMFFTDNPAVAATYGNPDPEYSAFAKIGQTGAIFPVYVKAISLKEFPVQIDRSGDRRFDMFEFDRQAKMLGPGQGLVVRQISDLGPRTTYEADPENHRYKLSDTYAFGRGTSIKSAVGNNSFTDDPRMTEHSVNMSRGFMMKTFREILSEKDDEFTYYVRSTANIHDPAIFEKLRLSWLPYVVKSFEVDSYKPVSKTNSEFPGEPNSAAYSIKVVTGLPIPKQFIQTMAMDAHIHTAHLKIDPEGDFDPVNEPGEVPAADAQMAVGQKRIGEFIKELQQDRKKRQEMTSEREVYESFYTTHRGLEDVLKKPVRKGYYMIETSGQDGKTYLRAVGPFEARPEGNDYRDRIVATTVSLVNERTIGDKYGVQVIVEGVKTK